MPTTGLLPGATGFAERIGGRQHISSSGLSVHKGVFDANTLRASGRYLAPTSGTGVEVVFVGPPDYASPGTGVIQVLSRDTSTWLDLNISAKNINLQPQSGKVTMPAGTAQALLAQNILNSGWQIPATNVWYESDSKINVTTTVANAVLRVEACGVINLSTVGALCHVALGLDGAITHYSLQTLQPYANGTLINYSVFGYQTPSTVGVHRVGVFFDLTAGTGGFWNGANQLLCVTEQRA